MSRESKLSALGLPAYHGSPHDFDKFSLHKIGTGEGAQAYGWGLYFAGDKALAEHYRTQLPGGGDGGLLMDGVPFRELNRPRAEAIALVRIEAIFRGGSGKTAVQAFQRGIDQAEREATEIQAEIDEGIAAGKFAAEEVKEEIKLVEASRREAALLRTFDPAQFSFKTLGQTYKVEIPEHAELLDYAATMDKQPEGVLEKLLKSGLLEITPKNRWVFAGSIDVGPIDRVTGKAFYDALIQAHSITIATDLDVQGAAEWASKRLLHAGIPGLRYLDSVSRNRSADKAKTYNYVIWDEGRVEVREKLHGFGSARRWMRTPGGRR